MSKFEYYARPLVAFDPANREHRKFFHQFMELQTWGHCPVRFICPEEYGSDLVKMMTRQVAEYYIRQEFRNVKPKKDLQHHTKGRKRVLGLTNGGHGVVLD